MGHLDDLPTRTTEHVGETESREAFRRLFKDPLFVIRREDEIDYGTDFWVEVQFLNQGYDTSPTNIRFHAQIKASTKGTNMDGSFSYSVDRKNLNYLLNSPRSIYVFFARDTGASYYRWAEEVLVEYEKSGTAWQTQHSITVRFYDVLDHAAVQVIHERMIEEALGEKDLRLKMRLQGVYMSGPFTYDPSKADLTDHGTIAEYLGDHGLGLAAHGQADEVLRLVNKLPPEELNGTLLLAKAYAAYLLSQMGTAFEALKGSGVSTLRNDTDRALHAFLSATLSKSLGVLDYEKYVNEVAQIETQYPDSVSAIYARLERLRLDGVKNGGDGYAESARSIATRLQVRGGTWILLAIQADFIALELRYYAINRSFREQVVTFRMTEQIGIADAMVNDRAASAVLLVEKMRQWEKDFELALKIADGLHVDILVAEGLYVFCLCMIQETLINDKLVPPTPELAVGRTQQIGRTIARLEHACALFEKERATEQWVRTRLLLVNALWLKGDKADAVKEAADIERIAREEVLVDLHHEAARIVSGESPIGPFEDIPSIIGE
ncbi:MAG: DUF4365 domain-containing protein [Deltaproteobacteria bacterium]|nr:DUF4365 domain-containing protein [Deltaproteobacteria bacterium]